MTDRVKKTKKAFAYITNADRLLVFSHVGIPEAGIQVPAGSVGCDETLEAAVLREAAEETGLDDLMIERFLGCNEFNLIRDGIKEIHVRHFFLIRFQGFSPDTWRHWEKDPSHGEVEQIEFELFWLSKTQAMEQLNHGHESMLHKLSELT